MLSIDEKTGMTYSLQAEGHWFEPSNSHKNEAFGLNSEGFFVGCGHSNSFAVKRKTLDRAD
jgi:hypothetical protein